MNVDEPLDAALSFVEAINRRDLERLVDLMSEDHIFIDLAGDRHEGREVMRDGWRRYFEAYPEYMIHVSKYFVVGDDVILLGRTTGSHQALSRAEEFRQPLIWVAGTRNGKVTRWQIFPDFPEVRSKLKISPEEMVGQFIQLANDRDLDGLSELMTEDHAFANVDGGIERGRELAIIAWRDHFAAYPEYRIEINQIMTIEDVVIVIGQVSGAHLPPEVQLLETVIWTARINQDGVAEWRILYADAEKVKELLRPY